MGGGGGVVVAPVPNLDSPMLPPPSYRLFHSIKVTSILCNRKPMNQSLVSTILLVAFGITYVLFLHLLLFFFFFDIVNESSILYPTGPGLLGKE